MSNLPLNGVRVLDLSSVVVGPYTTQFLADYGAAITKIEPLSGDIIRTLGGASKSGELSPKFMNLNRGKKSLAIDLKHEAVKPVISKLLAGHDVIVSNMRPKALAKLGLDYEAARAARADVIYCSIVGFGRDGRYKDKPAYDNVIQGMGGIAACHDRQDGEPKYLPMVLADRLAGLAAVQAILVAVIHRMQTGDGQFIEIPMFENTAVFVLNEHIGQLIYPGSAGPSGDLRVLSKYARPVKTKDGYICISANNDKQALGLFEAIGKPELKNDPRFESVQARYANIDAYNAIRNEAMPARTTADWVEALDRRDVPAMPYKTFEDLMADPHLADVGLFEEREHPDEGRVVTLRPAPRFSAGMIRSDVLAPRLGQDSADVLKSVGCSQETISRLTAAGAVLDRPLKENG